MAADVASEELPSASRAPVTELELDTAEAGLYAPFVRKDAFRRCGLTVRLRQKARLACPPLPRPYIHPALRLSVPCAEPTPPPLSVAHVDFSLTMTISCPIRCSSCCRACFFCR